MRKVVFIISGIDFSLGFEWLEINLDRNQFEPIFIFLNHSEPELYKNFTKKGVAAYYLPMNGKASYLKVFFQICKILVREKPKVVHSHLFDACILGLLAAKLLGVENRIYTRHHSTYHFDYFPKMVKYDRIINLFSTRIVAISENVKNVLVARERVPANKVVIVNHGFDLEKFVSVPTEQVNLMRKKYAMDSEYPVVGVISRFTKWKGVQNIIPAFKRILVKYPNACLFLSNAIGDYKSELEKLFDEIPARNIRIVAFEKDIFSLYQLFDIFVHVPIDSEAEAFGQTYVEALAAGVPSIFTLSGIAREFVIDRENALVVPFMDEDAIERRMIELIENSELRSSLILKGRISVMARFQLKEMMIKLTNIYNG
jgi:glycosyltransferase involved in cell wall biosynthesis